MEHLRSIVVMVLDNDNNLKRHVKGVAQLLNFNGHKVYGLF